jgi:hypothetical protein
MRLLPEERAERKKEEEGKNRVENSGVEWHTMTKDTHANDEECNYGGQHGAACWHEQPTNLPETEDSLAVQDDEHEHSKQETRCDRLAGLASADRP